MRYKKIDKIRIGIFLFCILICIALIIRCEKGEKWFFVPMFLFSLYPISKIGYGNNIKI